VYFACKRMKSRVKNTRGTFLKWPGTRPVLESITSRVNIVNKENLNDFKSVFQSSLFGLEWNTSPNMSTDFSLVMPSSKQRTDIQTEDVLTGEWTCQKHVLLSFHFFDDLKIYFFTFYFRQQNNGFICLISFIIKVIVPVNIIEWQ